MFSYVGCIISKILDKEDAGKKQLWKNIGELMIKRT